MTDIAIRVENLSKQYRIGGKLDEHKTLRESLTQGFTGAFRLLSSVARGRPVAAAKETVWALKDISFEVKRGEVLGIIGRNGAGKSTLLKILSRITEPTKGYAEVHGRVGSLLEVGTGFHPELTGRENIYLNGAILGMKKAEIENKFDEIVAFAEIERFIDTPVKHYSSGMYMRLAFSVAAHLQPDILLVDEVLAVGDINFQQKCVHKMGVVAKEGRTVLVVSHNMRVVESLAERCIYLTAGIIQRNGATLEVIKQYQAEALDHSYGDDLPSEFNVENRKPAARLSHITLTESEASQKTAVFEPGTPMRLSFAILAEEDIPDAVICVRVYRDGLPISGNNSDHELGRISLRKSQTRRCQIDFDALWLTPGRYKLVIFVLPSYFSRLVDSLSEFYGVDLIIKGSRKYGGGYVYMRQRWMIN